MKILIDAHKTSLLRESGIGVYAKNLMFALNSLDMDVFALHAMNQGKGGDLIDTLTFFQDLYHVGERPRALKDISWKKLIQYTVSAILKIPLSPNQITDYDFVDLKHRGRDIPFCASPVNLQNIFRGSQYIGALFKKNVLLDASRLRIDVLHLTMPLLPISIKNAKKVVTLHDVIPLKFPHCTTINLKAYKSILETTTRDADMFFAISKTTKQDFVEILKIPEEKIFVTGQSSFIPDDIKNIEQKHALQLAKIYGLEAQKYFVFYGAIEPKKNVENLLSAFCIANTDCKLVILGGYAWGEPELKNMLESKMSTFRDRVIYIPYSSFLMIACLLKCARALIFPSLYEGFGLPILEAMQMGCPVITSNVGAILEVAGKAAYYVEPKSITSIRLAIEDLSSYDDAALSNMSQKGLARASIFSMAEYKKKVKRGYDQLFSQTNKVQ